MNRPLSYCTLIIFWVLSVQATKAQTTDLIGEHFKLLNSHDIKGLANEYAIDAMIYSPNWEGPKIGPSGITEVYGRYYKTTPDLAYTITNTIKSGIILSCNIPGVAQWPSQKMGNPLIWKEKSIYCNAVRYSLSKTIK